MRRFGKKLTLLLASVVLTATILLGCQNNGDLTGANKTSENTGAVQSSDAGVQPTSGSDGEIAMGRYLEEDVALPEKTMNVMAMASQTDGSVRMAVTDQEGNRAVWTSNDLGASWTKVSDFPEDIRSAQEVYFYKSAMSENGEMAFVRGDDEGNFTYVYVDKEMTVKTLNFFPEKQQTEAESESEKVGENDDKYMNMITEFRFADNEKLVALGNRGVYVMDTKSGEIVQTFEQENSVNGIYAVGDTLIVFTQEEMSLYDIESGKQLEKDKVLEDQIKADNASNGLGNSSSGEPLLFVKGTEENSLYYCYKNGLYSHTIGGNISEQIIDGKLNSLNSPSIAFVSMAVLDKTSFLVLCNDNGNYKILRYVYSKDTPTVPGTELKIYSLNENSEIRQAIALFQKANPDIFVTMEVGMTGDDAVTYSDALRTLNTNILADKGPDLLVLDGMPVESYIDKGILEDLGDILSELDESNGFLENIQKAYEADGKIMAVPSKFKILGIQGNISSLEAITDLKTLADQGEKLRQENPDIKKVLDMSQLGIFINNLYNVSSKSWEKEDKSLDQEKITDFFTQLKRLYSLDDHSQDEEIDPTIRGAINDVNSFGSISVGILERMQKNQPLGIGEITGLNDLAMVISSNSEMENMSYQPLNGQSENIFIPNTILGMSAKGRLKEESSKFISFMLSTEIQALNQGGGFPVNRAAFEEVFINKTGVEGIGGVSSSNNQTGEMISLEIKWPSNEEINKFKEYVELLTTTPLMDSIIKETVIEQAKRCLKEEISVEDAVKNVMQKVNLYLME